MMSPIARAHDATRRHDRDRRRWRGRQWRRRAWRRRRGGRRGRRRRRWRRRWRGWKRGAALAHRRVDASICHGGEGHASVRVVEDVPTRVVASVRPCAVADDAELPTLQSGRGAALILGERSVWSRVPEQLEAVPKDGATFVVDPKAQSHTGVVCDSVFPGQLGPSAGRATCPPCVANTVGDASPLVLGQVGAYNHSSECRGACTAGAAKCTEGERVTCSCLHAVRASRQACHGVLRRALGVDEAQ